MLNIGVMDPWLRTRRRCLLQSLVHGAAFSKALPSALVANTSALPSPVGAAFSGCEHVDLPRAPPPIRIQYHENRCHVIPSNIYDLQQHQSNKISVFGGDKVIYLLRIIEKYHQSSLLFRNCNIFD